MTIAGKGSLVFNERRHYPLIRGLVSEFERYEFKSQVQHLAFVQPETDNNHFLNHFLMPVSQLPISLSCKEFRIMLCT